MFNESIIRSVAIFIASILFVVVAYSLGKTYLRNQAVDSCMIQSTAKWESQSNTGYNYSPEWLDACLREKGLK